MEDIMKQHPVEPSKSPLGTFIEEPSEDDKDTNGVPEEDEYDATFDTPSPSIHRTASTSSTSSIRSAWQRKQSLAISQVRIFGQVCVLRFYFNGFYFFRLTSFLNRLVFYGHLQKVDMLRNSF